MDAKQDTGSRDCLKITLIILIILFIASVCCLGIVYGDSIRNEYSINNIADSSIGGFIDIYPGGSRYTRYVIIGGRVFYADKEPKNIAFPETEEDEQVTVREFLDLSDIAVIDSEDEASEYIPDYARYKPSSYHYAVRRSLTADTDRSGMISDVELFAFTGDTSGAWTQEADLDLFKSNTGEEIKLAPGTSGYFRFQLNNKSGTRLHVTVSVKEPESGIHLPMVFNMKEEKTGRVSDSTLLGKDKAVELGFYMEPESSGTYCLNWKWPYESGDDVYDSIRGIESGKYILNTMVYVEEVG